MRSHQIVWWVVSTQQTMVILSEGRETIKISNPLGACWSLSLWRREATAHVSALFTKDAWL